MKVIVIRNVIFDSTVYGVALDKQDEERRNYSYNCIKLVEQGVVTLGSAREIFKELTDTPQEFVKDGLIELYQKLNKIELTVDDEITSLAIKYLEKLDITRVDALLIAICSKNRIDALISWNRRHLVNEETQKTVKRINDESGFKTPLILAQLQEVFYLLKRDLSSSQDNLSYFFLFSIRKSTKDLPFSALSNFALTSGLSTSRTMSSIVLTFFNSSNCNFILTTNNHYIFKYKFITNGKTHYVRNDNDFAYTRNTIAYNLTDIDSSTLQDYDTKLLRLEVNYTDDAEGKTTYQFSNTTDNKYGLQSMSKPWIVLMNYQTSDQPLFVTTSRKTLSAIPLKVTATEDEKITKLTFNQSFSSNTNLTLAFGYLGTVNTRGDTG